MKDEHESLNKGQLLGEQGVEDDCNDNCRNREQHCMPWLRNIVALVEDYKTLYL